ncbi:type II secretion system F family protein [Paraferrimonas sp. SM1919]|uniref:type II secretion system F family protein n=1 Tax=Paraferrimonas sp. SM1919 TaxID=2662263 RepID=UPI0013D4973F|nr:type II secretion system F family protein [Paraferrimonas sp. SM1919]
MLKTPNKLRVFKYKAINKGGDKVSGKIRATNLKEAKNKLKAKFYRVQSIKVQSTLISAFNESKITALEMAMLTRQIATMLNAGVPFIDAVELLSQGHEKNRMRELLQIILTEVSSGSPIAQALKSHPKYFDNLYIDLVDAGENSGALDTVFDRVATYLEKAEALKSKIKKAMFYPAAVTIVAVVVTATLLIKVVPQFESIFKGFDAELPVFTQFLIHASDFMIDWWFSAFISIILFWLTFKFCYQKSAQLRDKLDHFALKTPLLGEILQKAAIARFSRTLATTFAAGVSIIDGLESAARASGNAKYRDAIIRAKNQIVTGMQLNIALSEEQVLPPMVVQMIQIGEEAGALDEMLNKVANIYEMQVDDAVEGLSSLIEPIIMVVIGTIVGGLIIGMYLPIFQLGSVIG